MPKVTQLVREAAKKRIQVQLPPKVVPEPLQTREPLAHPARLWLPGAGDYLVEEGEATVFPSNP